MNEDLPQPEYCDCPGPCTGACRLKNNPETALSKLHELSRIIQEERDKQAIIIEKKWKALSHEDQQDYFYAVVKRIHQGDVVDGGTYRYVLYNVFGWGPESYGMGMECGYMDLHNHIWNTDQFQHLLKNLSKHFDLDYDELWKWFTRNHHV